MCDTLYNKTATKTIFGKNSDRSANEPNLCLYYPKKGYDENLQATYINLGKVKKEHSILLVQPSWMWGGEMGINDRGVVIGNEAVFTKSSNKKQARLLGMDLLRLGLELADDAKQAVDVIIKYLEEFGQGGNCGFDKLFYYDNSFLIVDGQKAYILETSGKDWVLKEIKDQGNISNCLSIDADYLESSKQNPGFSKRNTDPIFTYFSKARIRSKSVFDGLSTNVNNVPNIMAILKSHCPLDEKKLYKKGSVRSVCMHQSMLGDHTTGSMIVEFHNPTPTIWLTGCSTPCLSIYKPTYLGNVVAPVFSTPQASLEYWLDREYLHRGIYGGLIDKNTYIKQKDELQLQFITEEAELFKREPSINDLYNFANKCSKLEGEFINSYLSKFDNKNKIKSLPRIWKKKQYKLGKNVFMTNLRERS